MWSCPRPHTPEHTPEHPAGTRASEMAPLFPPPAFERLPHAEQLALTREYLLKQLNVQFTLDAACGADVRARVTDLVRAELVAAADAIEALPAELQPEALQRFLQRSAVAGLGDQWLEMRLAHCVSRAYESKAAVTSFLHHWNATRAPPQQQPLPPAVAVALTL
jgi:hypothetical protein